MGLNRGAWIGRVAVAFAIFDLVFAAAGAGVPPDIADSANDEPSSPLLIIREQPDDRWLPGISAIGGGVGGPWVRGPYTSIQVNVDPFGANIPGDAANEPSLAVSGNNIVIGWRQFDTVASNFRQAGWGYSHDDGQSWTFPGVIEPTVFRSDPVLQTGLGGQFQYYSLKVDNNVFTCQLFLSNDSGQTWGPAIEAFGGDKAWTAVDRTGGVGNGNVYAIWSWAAACCGMDTFTRGSSALGMGQITFIEPVPVNPTPVFGTMTVAADGTVYAAGVNSPSFSNPNFIVAKSTNAEVPIGTPTFQIVPVNMGGALSGGGVNPAGLLGQAWVDTDRSGGANHGNVYLLCSVNPPGNDPLDVNFSRSVDGGQTWSTAARVNDDAAGTNAWQWFGTMAVAPNGRIDAIWNDTRADPSAIFSELYYAYSTDAGQTWTQNVPVSLPFDPSQIYPSQDKLGDYYDMVSDNQGASIAYAATFNGEHDVYYLRVELATGDFDDDGDRDLADFAAFANCFDQPVGPECGPADLVLDVAIDLADFASFEAIFTGPQ